MWCLQNVFYSLLSEQNTGYMWKWWRSNPQIPTISTAPPGFEILVSAPVLSKTSLQRLSLTDSFSDVPVFRNGLVHVQHTRAYPLQVIHCEKRAIQSSTTCQFNDFMAWNNPLRVSNYFILFYFMIKSLNIFNDYTI